MKGLQDMFSKNNTRKLKPSFIETIRSSDVQHSTDEYGDVVNDGRVKINYSLDEYEDQYDGFPLRPPPVFSNNNNNNNLVAVEVAKRDHSLISAQMLSDAKRDAKRHYQDNNNANQLLTFQDQINKSISSSNNSDMIMLSTSAQTTKASGNNSRTQSSSNNNNMLFEGEPSRSNDEYDNNNNDIIGKVQNSLSASGINTNTANSTTTTPGAIAISSIQAQNNNNNTNNKKQRPAVLTLFDREDSRQDLLRGDEIASKIPNANSYISWINTWLLKSGLIYFLVFLITAAGMVYGVSESLANDYNQQRIDWDVTIEVAFLGNAYLFVNDVPRVLEALSTGHIYQNSCIHAGGSLHDLWITGNGMYTLWQTDEAIIDIYMDDDLSYYNIYNNGGGNANNDYDYTTYDYGLCTVAQTLQGYDEYIDYGNTYGKYYDDGENPCIVDKYYANFIKTQLQRDPVQWDYVVLVDQTKRMAIEQARNETIKVLKNGYGPFLKESGAIPIIVDTHAFWSDNSNMTGLVDIPTFTTMIYDGVYDYIDTLSSVLHRKQKPRIAPIGLAYLTIYEEDYDLWLDLFMDDNIHSSLCGTYLFAIVLYATMFQHMPDEIISQNIPALFGDSRKIMGGGGQNNNFNCYDDIQYIYNVAKRVTLQNYIPNTFKQALKSNNNDRKRRKRRKS